MTSSMTGSCREKSGARLVDRTENTTKGKGVREGVRKYLVITEGR
jgi:hypothetical protein